MLSVVLNVSQRLAALLPTDAGKLQRCLCVRVGGASSYLSPTQASHGRTQSAVRGGDHGRLCSALPKATHSEAVPGDSVTDLA